MTKKTHVVFDSYIGRKKPETIIRKERPCPFCDRTKLEGIIAQQGSIILLKNKFPVLKDTMQTVLIESDHCQGDISNYAKEHLYRLLQFGIEQWHNLMHSKEFTSVSFFRNYGPLSGGSIAHPHSQIVAFHHHNYLEKITEQDFIGLPIDANGGIELNLSTLPRAGFYEFNISMNDASDIKSFADYIQLVARYLLHDFVYKCSSYNIFYYPFKGKTIAKITPRFITSPLLIGYAISQVPNNLEEVVQDLRSKYL